MYVNILSMCGESVIIKTRRMGIYTKEVPLYLYQTLSARHCEQSSNHQTSDMRSPCLLAVLVLAVSVACADVVPDRYANQVTGALQSPGCRLTKFRSHPLSWPGNIPVITSVRSESFGIQDVSCCILCSIGMCGFLCFKPIKFYD